MRTDFFDSELWLELDDEDNVDELELEVGGGFFIRSNFVSKVFISCSRIAFLSSFLFRMSCLVVISLGERERWD